MTRPRSSFGARSCAIVVKLDSAAKYAMPTKPRATAEVATFGASP